MIQTAFTSNLLLPETLVGKWFCDPENLDTSSKTGQSVGLLKPSMV